MNDEITESDFFYIKPPLLDKGKHLAEFFFTILQHFKNGTSWVRIPRRKKQETTIS